MKGLRLTIGINGIVHCFEEIGKMITNGLEKAQILNNANCDKPGVKCPQNLKILVS